MSALRNVMLGLVLSTSLVSVAAKAAGPVLPEYPRTECSGGICASVAKDGRGNIAQINVMYGRNRLQGKVTMKALLNGRELGSAEAHFGRDGITFYLPVKNVAQSSLEIYFVNDRGQYDSDFGRNFQFEL